MNIWQVHYIKIYLAVNLPFNKLINELNSTTNSENRVSSLKILQELEYELFYKYPMFTMGHMIYLDKNLAIPNDVTFGILNISKA